MKRCSKCFLPETHETLIIGEDGVCNICKAQGDKGNINWEERLKDLDEMISKYKGKGNYDCIVPFSGGKDSTWTLLYLKKRYPDLKPLVVRFNHGFLRSNLRRNSEKTFRKLGVDVHEFTPNWNVVKRLMLQSFIEKGDFCWHCHTGIFSYPMKVAIKENTPLIIWGEPSSEYTAYYSYDELEEVNEERFNRYINLGITADDMAIRLMGKVDDRDLEPFRYPMLKDLMKIEYRSICLGTYIPWDVKRQVTAIKEELDWQGDLVENVPEGYNYEKIECWMQGVRDYIKFIKRGYTRPTHLAAIDLRNGRITKEEAQEMIERYEGKKPASLALFLEYTGLSEEEFYNIAMEHSVSPWKFDKSEYGISAKLPDHNDWIKGDGLTTNEAREQCQGFGSACESCGIN